MGMSLVMAIVIAEVGLRIYYPSGEIPAAHLESASDEEQTGFQEDAEAGYLPVVGRGEYGPHGCLPNDYQLDQRRAPRVLFTGDSVTHRGKIVEALKKLYGADTYEYWNAGVESFNTLQEWVFYKRHNHKIEPDHVVLTFHNNDFRATPLVVREGGEIKIYQPGTHINPWLFRRSYLYRWAWPDPDDTEARRQKVRQSLMDFRDALQGDNKRFTVILHPMLKPYSSWSDDEKNSRELSLSYFKELEIRYIDLLPVSEKALEEGLEVTEAPGDVLHPNDEMAARFARELQAQNLLP